MNFDRSGRPLTEPAVKRLSDVDITARRELIQLSVAHMA